MGLNRYGRRIAGAGTQSSEATFAESRSHVRRVAEASVQGRETTFASRRAMSVVSRDNERKNAEPSARTRGIVEPTFVEPRSTSA